MGVTALIWEAGYKEKDQGKDLSRNYILIFKISVLCVLSAQAGTKQSIKQQFQYNFYLFANRIVYLCIPLRMCCNEYDKRGFD